MREAPCAQHYVCDKGHYMRLGVIFTVFLHPDHLWITFVWQNWGNQKGEYLMKKGSTFLFYAIAVCLLAGGAALGIPSSAKALATALPGDQLLSLAYKNEQVWLLDQQAAITTADQAGTEVQQLIDAANKAGLNTTDLQNALNVFNTSMAEVKTGHQSAADTLTAHNGFDGNGNVTDRQTARITALDAKQSLWKTHVTLVQASRDLYLVVQTWKNANIPHS
jgi:hypothetical protein